MTANYSIFIGICLLNPTLTNVGLGLQKLAINRMPAPEYQARKQLYALIWAAGLSLQGVVVALQAKALSIGNASTLGGFAGFGLISLALFSHLILKEKILRRELAGMLVIIAGTAMLGFFSHGHQRGVADFEQQRMTLFLLAFCVAAAAAVAFMLRDIRAYGGAVFGLLGGAVGGLGLVFLKIVMSGIAGKAGSSGLLLHILTDPYTWLAVVGGIGGVVLVQVGYKFGKAIQVVPGFSSMVVIMPALCGFVVLRESLPPICIASLTVITAGVLVTTTADRSAETVKEGK
jgi:drug/metabolite transporter (DMT)-like permease